MINRLVLAIYLIGSCTIIEAQVKKEFLYVGTFSIRGSEGIYVYSFNRAKRTLTLAQKVPSLESPSYLEIHPSKKFLYSVNRGPAGPTDIGGSVSAYGIDQKTGKLSGLNNRASFGAEPCHISFDRQGQHAFVSNYVEGNFVVLPLFDDGLIGNPTDSKKYIGSSINTSRQESPHVHSAGISPDGQYVYVADLGTDKVYNYKFDADNGKLENAQDPEADVKPGTGPRHFTFHPNGNFFYLAEELTSTVAVFSVNRQSGRLNILQDSVLSLPATFQGKNTSADIHTDPTGKFLYLSNRGANVISIFSIAKDGKIKLIGQQDTQGLVPRNFLVDPKGEFLFVANQDSDTIVLFRINQKTGKLTLTGKPLKVPSPVCLKLVTLP